MDPSPNLSPLQGRGIFLTLQWRGTFNTSVERNFLCLFPLAQAGVVRVEQFRQTHGQAHVAGHAQFTN